MRRSLSLLYRGPLSSCNYDCAYCPFAKRHETAAQLQTDRRALERFARWAGDVEKLELSLLLTPWGEALTRPWYHTATARLTQLSHVRRVAVQTNLSWSMDWLDDVHTESLALWCTYHPSQTTRTQFLSACAQLQQRQIRHSVGMVALPDDFDEIRAMRRLLPATTYLWLNAWDVGDGQKYDYSDAQFALLSSIDPWFAVNRHDHPSLGRPCATGTEVFSVDGRGDVRRCHFVPDILGNLYAPQWQFPEQAAGCPNQTCGCHIGYVHLPHLKQTSIYGDGILERVPLRFLNTDPHDLAPLP